MSRIFAVAIALLVVCDAIADESRFRYRLIADRATPVPGGTGTFQGFGTPSIDGDTLAFIGVPALEPDRHGIFIHHAGELRLVVNNDTPVPNGTASFHHFGSAVSLAGQNVAFWGQHVGPLEGSIQGVYATRDGLLGIVADHSTNFPGSGGPIAGFDGVDVFYDGGRAAFVASDANNRYGLLVSDGATTRLIADTLTPMPNGSGLLFNAGFNGLSLDGERVAFWSAHGGPEVNGVPFFKSGIFLYDGSTMTTIADTSTILPGATAAAGCLGGATSMSNGKVVFSVDDRPNCVSQSVEETFSGAYLWENGNVVRLADTTTTVPGLAERFSAVGALAIDGENIALLGTWGTGANFTRGLFLWRDGDIQKILDTNDTLQGRSIQDFNFGREGLSGDSFAFTVRFEDDNSEAIYVASIIPEPSTLALVTIGTATLLAARRRGFH